MGRPRKLPSIADLGTEPITLRVKKSLNEDFAIFAAYMGANNPSEVIRRLMMDWVDEKKKDRMAMEFYATRKASPILVEVVPIA